VKENIVPNTDPEPTTINAQNRLGRLINFRWRHSHPVAASAPVSSPPGEIAKPEVSIHSAQLDVALDIAVRAAAQNTGANAVAIALMQGGRLVCRARLGDIAPDLGAVLNVSTGITGACVRTAQILNCADTQTDVRVDAEVCRILGIRSILVVPILANGTVAGLVEALSVNPGTFGPRHVEWLQKVAAFVHELAFGKATIAPFDKASVPEPPSLFSSPGGSAELSSSLDSPEADSKSLEDDPGLTAFRGALEKIGPASSWDDISQELLSRLQK
jgi:putative methionine-R-sulfoxide reductase with GAF domain